MVALGSSKLLFLVATISTIIVAAPRAEAQPEAQFKCSSKESTTCVSLIDYANPNATTLNQIQTLFNVKHLLDLLGANNLSSNTRGNYRVNPNLKIKIPFNCKCSNGTGLSNGVPMYTVKGGDELDKIARVDFAGLVKYQQIQIANKIPDPNTIEVGQKLWIPLPCSCDEVGGKKVMHYGYLVEPGNSVKDIADKHGTTLNTLLELNGISDPKKLEAGQVLDVPLPVCSSTVRNDSLDFPLLVPNGADVYTANNCIKCKCDSANNWTLQCEPSQLKPTNWSTCPSMQCNEGSSNLTIGNTTASTNSCSRNTCAYTGYSSQKISATFITQNVCLAPAPSGAAGGPGSGATVGPGSGAAGSTMQGWVWNNLFIAIHFILFSAYLLL